jgi:hypothetical protein
MSRPARPRCAGGVEACAAAIHFVCHYLLGSRSHVMHAHDCIEGCHQVTDMLASWHGWHVMHHGIMACHECTWHTPYALQPSTTLPTSCIHLLYAHVGCHIPFRASSMPHTDMMACHASSIPYTRRSSASLTDRHTFSKVSVCTFI